MNVEYAFPNRERAERFAMEQRDKGRFYKVVATDTGYGVVWDEAAAERWRREWLHVNGRMINVSHRGAVVVAIALAALGWLTAIIWTVLR